MFLIVKVGIGSPIHPESFMGCKLSAVPFYPITMYGGFPTTSMVPKVPPPAVCDWLSRRVLRMIGLTPVNQELDMTGQVQGQLSHGFMSKIRISDLCCNVLMMFIKIFILLIYCVLTEDKND